MVEAQDKGTKMVEVIRKSGVKRKFEDEMYGMDAKMEAAERGSKSSQVRE